jgi:hypothetical protein
MESSAHAYSQTAGLCQTGLTVNVDLAVGGRWRNVKAIDVRDDRDKFRSKTTIYTGACVRRAETPGNLQSRVSIPKLYTAGRRMTPTVSWLSNRSTLRCTDSGPGQFHRVL